MAREFITDENGKPIITWHFFDDLSTTVYAHWEQINYAENLYFVNEDGENVFGAFPDSIYYGEDYVFPKCGKDWLRFVGWYYGDIQLTDADGNSLAPWTFAEDITYNLSTRYEVPNFVTYFCTT